MIQTLVLLAAITGQAPSSDGLAILDFNATWCGPCQAMKPAIDSLIAKGYPIRQIDGDKNPELASKYKITAYPTLVLVNGETEIKRTSQARTVSEIAAWFDDAKPAASPRAPRPPPVDVVASSNPKPWQTVVRIRIVSPKSTVFGSGTVIYSDANGSIVLTCAHIFKLDGLRQQPKPDKFQRPIKIDLFDGELQGTNPAKVKFVETVSGIAIDYDFKLDVGLIRIPGKQLPFSPVAPERFEPKAKMKVLAMGCPEGQDATAWHTIVRKGPHKAGLTGSPDYEAIECDVAPKEGRSGGGLYTLDGFVIGVCNFAEPQGQHGLYASQHSIYKILDRNSLSVAYADVSKPQTQIAARARPAPEVVAETATDLEAACLNIFKRKGLNGKDGNPGKDGADGKNGVDGTNGKDGATPDLTAILKRLQALEEEVSKPITVKIRTPSGEFQHDYKLRANKDGTTGIGAGFPNRMLGIDLSDFAVPAKAPSK